MEGQTGPNRARQSCARHASRICPLTQSLTAHSSTDVGLLVNFQVMYSFNTWLLAGMILERERHPVDQERPFRDLGHQDTLSVLPTVEVCPIRFGPIRPYANMSVGVNMNSIGENSRLVSLPATPLPGESAGVPTMYSRSSSR